MKELPEGYTFVATKETIDGITWGMLTLPAGYEEKCMYAVGMGYYWEE